MESDETTAFTVAVLAGGASRRMGAEKSLVELAGKPLIVYPLDRLRRLNAPLLLVTNTPDRYRRFGAAIVADVVPGKGALGGIYSALVHSTTPYTLCVACDMPFLDVDLLTSLLSLRDGFDAVVPTIGAQPQGLHAVYHRRCREPIRARIDRDDLRLSGLFDDLRVRYVEEFELRAVDPDLRSFTNLNTPEELIRARREIGDYGSGDAGR